MGSSRLPGKVMKTILGKPALTHLIERLRRVKRIDEIVVATTVNPADDVAEDLARSLGVRCFRGSEEDVLDRVARAAASVAADVIVEITGDCPLLAPEVIERALDIYLTSDYDVVCNTWKPSYPQGVDAQVFAYRLLEEVSKKALDAPYREHVSLYFYEHPQEYKIHVFAAPPEFRAPELRFQLDYPEDLEFITAIYEELYPRNPEFSLQEIFDLLRRRPELRQINAHCVEKPLR